MHSISATIVIQYASGSPERGVVASKSSVIASLQDRVIPSLTRVESSQQRLEQKMDLLIERQEKKQTDAA